MTVLLLAGTAEARTLARRWPQDVPVIASLAGATTDPIEYPCETRIGGFGGIDGLSAFLACGKIEAVIDATHPFATGISANAAIACERVGMRRLTLRRAAWTPEGDWAEYPTFETLAEALPTGAHPLLTTGRGEVASFAIRKDVSFVLRSIEPPDDLPSHIQSVRARPPFTLEDEIGLMKRESITHLVTKNAGGARPAKIDAALMLGLPILSIAMPRLVSGPNVTSVDEALRWIATL